MAAVSSTNQPILIVAATDNHYAVLLAALIKSIEVNHHTGEPLCFYVIDDNISGKNKRRIESAIESPENTLTWVDSAQILSQKVTLPLDNSSLPDTALLRLFAPLIIPPGAEKVLYLDVDMIVQADISGLWHTDLGDHPVAAVQDRDNTASSGWITIPNYADLGIPGGSKYFNSGLLLINTKKWQELEIPARVIRCIQENLRFASLPDQYGLNVILNNQWLELDPLWNSFSDVKVEQPKLIHYIMTKPIFRSYNGLAEYREIFYHYLNQTKFANFRPLGTYHITMKKIRTRITKLNRKLRAVLAITN